MSRFPLSRRTFLAGSAACLLPATPRAQTVAAGALVPYRWQPPSGIDGISGIETDAEGLGFHMLTDRGRLVAGRFIRDPGGQIADVSVSTITQLADSDGRPLRGRRADSEGLAIAPDGTVFVSFEAGPRTRVARFQTPSTPAVDLPVHPRFHVGIDGTRTLEALAIDRRGALFTLPQEERDGAFELFRFDGRDWQIVGRIPRRDGLRPAGADFGPDGNLYLLEQLQRRLSVRNRVSRLLPDRWDAPQTLLEFEADVFGNYEGIAVSRTPSGALRLTLISDNNFASRLRTDIAEVVLP